VIGRLVGVMRAALGLFEHAERLSRNPASLLPGLLRLAVRSP
jgi:hypothetical protein